ncbi:MAG: VRR-NUC domain-containing protein [Anaerotignaceae bacterium]
MLEKNVENHLKNKVKLMGGIALKINSASMAGLPDRMVLFPEGKIFFVELKAPGKKPRPLQMSAHRLLQSLGVTVYVIDSIDGVQQFLEEVIANEVHTT